MQEIEYYDHELKMSSYFCNGEWYLDKPSEYMYLGMTCDSVIYRVDGKIHRVGGPALIRSEGTTAWYFDGVRHREDGPAVEFSNGRKAWYINGIEYTEVEFPEQCKR